MFEERRVRINLEVRNEFGSEYRIEVEFDPDDKYNTLLNQMGIQVNNIMKVMGYTSFDKDCVFMESVTIEEAEMLTDFLCDLRYNNEGCK